MADAQPQQAPASKHELVIPQFMKDRLAIWEKLKASRKQHESSPISIGVSGKTVQGVAHKTSPFDVLDMLDKKDEKKNYVAAKVDEKLWDLFRPLEKDVVCLQFVTFDSEDGKEVFWHSSAHLLGYAMECVFPHGELVIGPAVDSGFYYDIFLDKESVSAEQMPMIEKKMEELAGKKDRFERMEISQEEAKELFGSNRFKQRILNEKIEAGSMITAYRCGAFIDLCRGPHIPDLGKIKAVAVPKISSSYWMGKADQESLQRVYGVAFPSKDLYKEWKKFQEEAAKRDHRVIAKDQKLFFFHNLSPGSAFFLPHGTRIYNKLQALIRQEYWKRDYAEVIAPNMFNKELWLTSGHWAKYQENMFIFEVEKQQFSLKPMNCPGHCLIYQSSMRSYRDLPIRMAEFGVLHRNELSGTLTGLTRVRRFVQDDAHIFCRPDQIMQEVMGVLDLITCIYNIFNFKFELFLSTRPENFLGEASLWDKAEDQLKQALDAYGKPWKYNYGDGAFYGPKIDILVIDAMGRKHQCATCQLDFQMPIRFDLRYQAAEENVDEDKKEEKCDKKEEKEIHRPVMVHRAIYGSMERFIAVLIEHLGGVWPFWLSPRQAIVLPITNEMDDYAQIVRQKIHNAGYYADVDLSNRTLMKKVREAQINKYSYVLVVGKEEKAKGTVNVRGKTNDGHKEISIDDLLKEFDDKTKNFQ